MQTSQEHVRLRAYQLWEEEGRPDGKAMDHWSQAERELQGTSGDGGNNGGGHADTDPSEGAPGEAIEAARKDDIYEGEGLGAPYPEEALQPSSRRRGK